MNGLTNATSQDVAWCPKHQTAKWCCWFDGHCCYLSYTPPAFECGTRTFLRWVLSQGRSPTRQAVPKMPRTPSAFPFSGRLRRRPINPTPPKRVKAWGDGPLRPEVRFPVVEHTRTNCAARNHSRSRAPHHRTQSNAKNAPERERILCSLYQEESLFFFYACVISFSVRDLWEFLQI